MKNNKLDVDFILSNVKEEYGEESKKFQAIQDKVTACADVTDTDRCEAVSKMYACLGLTKDNEIFSI